MNKKGKIIFLAATVIGCIFGLLCAFEVLIHHAEILISGAWLFAAYADLFIMAAIYDWKRNREVDRARIMENALK